jgi:fatty-acid peroxygenase
LRAAWSPHAAWAFAQEVRRHYPFFPALVARVQRDFEWQGLRFTRGQRALLDIFGTNHDPQVWPDPWRFDPVRFAHRTPGPFELIAQGGADAATHHRCPGEDVALQLMVLALDMYLHTMHYRVQPQSMRVRIHRLPAMPEGGFLIGLN